jgi:hypothetical protein
VVSSDRWQWSETTRRYRDTKSGRFLAPATVLTLRDGYLDDRKAVIADLTARLVAGDLPVGDWLLALREQVRDLTLGEYAFGRGGRGAMSDDDYAAVGKALEGQYAYLQSFAESVQAGDLTARQVGARANLYPAAARQAFERGKAAAWGLELDQHPADGQTRCLANCRCTLEITDNEDEWRVRWVLHADESCEDCRLMARKWNPLVVKKETA